MGPATECPRCHHTDAPESLLNYTSVVEMARSPKALPPRAGVEPQQGELHDVAARVRTKVLWAARLCRHDLLRAVNRLATCVARWTSEHDLVLYRLMGYIASTRHLRMYSWVGDSLAQIPPPLHADSDLGGCAATHRSTFGRVSVAYGIPRRRRRW